MEVEVLSVSGAAPDQVVSIRAGGQRKQAAVSSLGQGIPFRLSSGPTGLNPFRIDILRQVGSARLAVRPGEGNYSIEVKDAGEGGGPVRVAFAVRTRKGEQTEPPPSEPRPKVRSRGPSNAVPMKEDEEKRFLSQTAVAKEYLEAHELLPFVRALLQTVIRDRPLDPYSFIAEQFRIAASAFKPTQPTPGAVAAMDAFAEPQLEKEAQEPDRPMLPKLPKPSVNTPEVERAAPPPDRPQDEATPAQDVAEVESLRLKIRDVLGQAAEDGTLAASLSQVEPPPRAPFAPLKAAEPLVIRRKAAPTPEAVKAEAALPLQTAVPALDANSSPPTDGEAALAKMSVEASGDIAEDEGCTGPLDALSVAESHEEDTKLAKEKPIKKLVPDADKGALPVPKEDLLKAVPMQAMEPGEKVGNSEPPELPAKPSRPAEVTPDSIWTAKETAPAKEKDLVPEQLERLRQKAQEALLNGAQTGELWGLLQRFAARSAGQKASAALCEAAQSGELVDALRKCGSAQAALASTEFNRLRQHAVESLVVAAESGKLLEALHERKNSEEERDRARALVQNAREQVAQAAASGQLATTLEFQANAGFADSAGSAGQDLAQLREVAREALLMAAESGQLAEVLAEATGTRTSPDDMLRTAARDALLRGAQSGQLLAELRKGKTRSLPDSPVGRYQETPASTVIDEMSEAPSDVQPKLSLHTAVAERLVKEMTDMAAELGRGSVVEQNTKIKAKIAELKRQYDKLMQERDELKSRIRS